MSNSMLIIYLITLLSTINYCSSATIVDPGNIFDRYNPIRSIVGIHLFDDTKLLAYNLPNRIVQDISNVVLIPWKGNDFLSLGLLPNMDNIYNSVPLIGSFVVRPSSSLEASKNYAPMANVEYARAPGSGSRTAKASDQNDIKSG